MSEQFDSVYWRGQGAMFLAPRNSSGNPLGFTFCGDVDSVEGTPNISTVKVKENVTGQRLTAASFTTDSEFPITINFKSVKPSQLAKALQADLTIKVAGTVDVGTPESVTAYDDVFSKLDHVKVSSVVVKDVTDTTTYVVDTDYVLHGDEGMIEVLSAGSISDEDVLHVSYSYAAQKHISANPSNTEYMLLFAGVNTANSDKRARCTIFKINIDPAFLSLIQQDTEGSLSVNAEMIVDTLRSSGNQLYQWEFED